MSRSDSERARIVSKPVPDEANRYRWHILRYLDLSTYPAGLSEVSEYVGSQVGTQPSAVRKTIHERDIPALEGCGSIKYDPESRLVCLQNEQESFAESVRPALTAGVISHLKPLRLVRFVHHPNTDETRH